MPPVDTYPLKIGTKQGVIASSASLSGVIDLEAGTPVIIEMPAGWDAAALTFQTSSDGQAFQNYYDSAGTEITVQAAAGRNIRFEPTDFAGVRFLKIRSGTSAAPVNQTAARTFNIALRVL